MRSCRSAAHGAEVFHVLRGRSSFRAASRRHWRLDEPGISSEGTMAFHHVGITGARGRLCRTTCPGMTGVDRQDGDAPSIPAHYPLRSAPAVSAPQQNPGESLVIYVVATLTVKPET